MNNNVASTNISVNLKIDKHEHKHLVTFPSMRMNNNRHNNNNTSNTIGNNNTNNSNNNYRYNRNRMKNSNTYDSVKNTLVDTANNNNNRNWNNTNRKNNSTNHFKGRISSTTTTIRSPTSTTSTTSSASTTSTTSPRTNKAKINVPQALLIQTIPPPQTRKQIHNQAMRAAMKRPTTPQLTLPGQKSYDGKIERNTNKYLYGSNNFDHLRQYNGNSNNLKTSISPMSQDSCTTVSVNSSPASSSDRSTFASVGNCNHNNHNHNTTNTTTNDDDNNNGNQAPTPKKLWRLKSSFN